MRFFINHFVVKIQFMNYFIVRECFNLFSFNYSFIIVTARFVTNFYFHYLKLHFQFNSFEIIKKLFKVFKYHWDFNAVYYLN